jgi:hypothetical protein
MGKGHPNQGTHGLGKSGMDLRVADATFRARDRRGKERATRPRKARSCGNCAVCCGGWLRLVVGTLIIDGAPCRYSTGHSCGIYCDRPTTCRDFACAWLKGESLLPSGFRPDKVGVIVLDHRLTWGGMPVDVLVVAGTPNERFLAWYKRYAIENHRLLLLQEGGLCSAFGPGDFLAEISARLGRGERLY